MTGHWSPVTAARLKQHHRTLGQMRTDPVALWKWLDTLALELRHGTIVVEDHGPRPEVAPNLEPLPMESVRPALAMLAGWREVDLQEMIAREAEWNVWHSSPSFRLDGITAGVRGPDPLENWSA